MNKLLVTGSTGLLGRALMTILKNNHHITAIGRTPSTCANVNIECDFSSTWDPFSLPEGVDTVVHLAQSEYFKIFPEKATDIFHTNVSTVINLLDYVRRTDVKRVILASSGGVYGVGEDSYAESMALKARSDLGFYAGTKFSTEILASNYAQFFDLVILRFFFIYGPLQKNNMLMPRLIASVSDGTPVNLQSENGIKLNPIYVEDAAKSVARAIHLEGFHTINIAGPEILTIREICEKIGENIKKTPEFKIVDSISPGHLVGDITQMEDKLRKPQINIEKGLRLVMEKTNSIRAS